MNKKTKDTRKNEAEFASAKEWQKAVEQVCKELEWKTQIKTVEGNTLIICPLQSSEQFMGALFVISEAESRLAIYLSYRIKTSSTKGKKIIEEISQLNFGRLGGCLEFDTESGEIRYRDSLLTAVKKVDLELLQTFAASSLQSALELYSEIKPFDETKEKTTKKESK